MGRGNTGLESREYDNWLASNKKERELRERQAERRAASKDYAGYHFGIDPRGPVKTKDKEEFKRELENRGLMLESDVPKYKQNIKRG